MEYPSHRPVSGFTKKLAAVAALLIAAGPAKSQSLLLETWNSVTGSAVTNLTSNANYPNSPSARTNPTVFEIANNSADNYGTRIRAFVTPPTTGNYTFWIACDDACELWFNSAGDNASGSTRIAYSTLWTNSREWTKYTTQQSAALSLTGGKRYYIETLHKENTGGDGLAVGWQGPGITGEAERPIPASRLQPFVYNISAPTITTQPANQAVNVGQTATFSVVASSTGLTYQWRKGGVNISGATSASYTTPATASGDNGALFSVVVSNGAGSATSTNATLTVNSVTAPAITTQPASQTVNVGQTATFSVVASGTAPLSYQWRKGGTNISGATSASYTTSATVSGDNGALFSVVVTNSAGSVTSANATLTVTSPTAPTITTQPANQAVNVGQTATFSVVASGTAPLSYQWRKGGVNISGATSASYTTPATVSGDNGALFSVVVSNSAGSVTSTNATLTVNSASAPSITTQPASQTVNVGQTATFSVVASGTAPLSYQWRKGGVSISGATSASYTTPATVFADNGASFSCVVTNSAGSVTSNGATLDIELITSRVTATRITATELVTSPQWEIPDYVFEKGYGLKSLQELEQYLASHKHLPEVPSAEEIKTKGMNMGEMNVKLLKNLEELTLQVIALQKEMMAKDSRFERQLDSLRILLETR